MAKNRNAHYLAKYRKISYQKALQFWRKHCKEIHQLTVEGPYDIRKSTILFWDTMEEVKVDG